MKKLITLCTYNERENLAELIPVLLQTDQEADLLVVDDNSPDGTSDLIASLAADHSRIHLIRRPQKLGLGTATTAAFAFGLQNNYDLLLNLDADFSHPPDVIPKLFAAVQNCDIAIASRYVQGGGVLGWSLGRKLMSQLINIWARLMLGLRVRDTSGSFRCYRVATLQKVDWSLAIAQGFAIPEEILFRCRRVGAQMQEVPYYFDNRRHGVTKINLQESYRAVRDIMRLGLSRIVN